MGNDTQLQFILCSSSGLRKQVFSLCKSWDSFRSGHPAQERDVCPACQPVSGGGRALGSPVAVKGSCRRRGWGSLMPDNSRRLLGSVLSTPFSARSTGQVQRAQKCAECQLCTREMENVLWSHKMRNMEFSFFFPPSDPFQRSCKCPTGPEPGGSPPSLDFIYSPG